MADGWSPIASHSVDVVLQPHEGKDFIFVLGYVGRIQKTKNRESRGIINKKPALSMMEKFKTTEQVDKALERLKCYWDELLQKYHIDSVDQRLNRMVNIWNQYQCMVTFNLSRSASYFESGIGRGIGFRDSNQDIPGFVHQVPDRARQRITDLAATQLEDGGSLSSVSTAY